MLGKINGKFSYVLGDSNKQQKSDSSASFSQLLRKNIDGVNQLNKKADNLSESFALGEIDNVHEVTVATEKAKTALNLTSAVQNKVVDSYEKIMQMQV
ncbi:MAG: flagellar hook-basal body complex protein FliE [bacterium]